MTRLLMALSLLAAPLALPVAAAQRDAGGIPTDVTRAIAAIYNDTGTIRVRGPVEISRDSVVRGTLAVRTGPVRIAGRIAGSLVVINADVTFLDGARVDGQVYVVGGIVDGRDRASIAEDFRAYAETLRYRIDQDELVVEHYDERTPYPMQRSRRDFWHQGDSRNYTDIDFVAINGGNDYNRVEGFPILIGPRLRSRGDWGTLTLQARAIFRTAEPIDNDRQSIGHDARAEIRVGNGFGLGVGGTAYDRVDPVESWQVSDHEAALAAVGIHRDYRDYFGRHGGNVFASMFLGSEASLSVSYGRERWESRAERDPWSLFRDREAWRPNPAVDEGHVRLWTTSLRIDSRNSRSSPGRGWFIQGDIERGDFVPSFSSAAAPTSAGGATGELDYTRGFIDLRRYNRLAPGAQLNLRFVTGGWMSGDPLPLQRRLSVGGPMTLPGFDFRSHASDDVDRLQCSEGGATIAPVAALCDRVALMQIEYRGSLSMRWDESSRSRWIPDIDGPTWLIFADAGRGWRARDDGTTTYPIESRPSFRSFKTDIGIGLDFGSASVAIAKSMSDRKEPANVVVRLARRF